MIGAAMQKALNEQINRELFSAYVYLGLSAQAMQAGFPGAAAWFRKQFEEETEHALKLYDHILERNGEVKLEAIAAPKVQFGSLLAAFEHTLEHERKVTASIHQLADLAIKEKDHAARVMLDWFVSEQVEEEANVQAVLDQLRVGGKCSGGILDIDRHLAKRE